MAYNLKQYVRRLWPYAIALVVTSVFACWIILLEQNAVVDQTDAEMNGSISGIAFFALAALAFVVRWYINAYVSFYKALEPQETEQPNFKQLLWAHILAFVIFVILTALLMLACVSVFAWERVGKTFAAFNTEWIYFVEFVIFLIIVPLTAYLVPVAWIVAFRYGKHKKLSLSVGIITLFCLFPSIILEILLLIHSSSTDMPSVWATIIALFAICVLTDIAMYLLTRRALKTEFNNKQIDKE